MRFRFDNVNFSRFGLGGGVQHSLVDLLSYDLTPPKPRSKRLARSTTARPAKTFLTTHSEGDELLGFVFFPKLLDQTLSLASELIKKITLDERKRVDVAFMTYITPNLSPSFVSPELFSEQDARSYCDNGLIRAALAAMHINAIGGQLPSNFTCADCNTDTYVSSGFQIEGKTGPIADNLLIEGPYERETCPGSQDDDSLEEFDVCDDEDSPSAESSRATLLQKDCPKVLMTIEIKSSNALARHTFNSVTRLKTAAKFKDSYVLRFVWPRDGTQGIKKTTKIIAQIYEQMFYHDVPYAILTSNDVTIFYWNKNTRLIYMSDQYDLTSMSPLHIFAWFCMAKGLLKTELVLPEPDGRYFNVSDPKNPNETGLRTGALFDILETIPTFKRNISDADILDDTQTTPKANPKGLLGAGGPITTD